MHFEDFRLKVWELFILSTSRKCMRITCTQTKHSIYERRKNPLFWKHPIWIIKLTILKEFIKLPYQMYIIIKPG